MSILRYKQKLLPYGNPMGGSSGGGGGPSQTTAYQTNLPEYARPYVETMLGAAQQQAYTFGPGKAATPDIQRQIGTDDAGQPIYETIKGTPATQGEVTGFRPYVPYGATVDAQGNITNTAQEQAAAAVAGFSPMQEQAFQGIANLQVPGQFGAGSQLIGAGGMGALQASRQAEPLMQGALGYGRAGMGFGDQGSLYGRQGLEYGAMGAGMSGMGFGAGQRFEQMATSPGAQAAYMSPYMQNVVDWQKEQAVRDYNINRQAEQARSVGAGAFGGSRQAVAQAEGNRALMNQLAGIQATGTQRAFEDAQRQMQFGSQLGLQGLQAGYQGLGMGIQGAQAGMQGAGLGIQGAQAGLQGIGQAVGAGQFGLQGLSQATQAGTAMGNIGAQQLQAQQGILGLQGQAGAQQQALEQQRINQAIQNYAMQQQYPMQQLSMMSSLLRGLPLQSATTQSYQAAPSAISQLGGLGAAGIGLYGMGRTAGAFKEGGVVKMADGGITKLSRRVLMNPEDFSAKQIDDMTKKGMISKLVGVPVLDAKMKDEQRMKMAQAAQQPKPADTIAAEIMARAAAQGIDNAPSNLPVMSAFDGGIVAMADGGEVDDDGIVRLQTGGTMAGFDDVVGMGRAAPVEIDEYTIDPLTGERIYSGYGRSKAAASPVPPPPKPTDTGIRILPDTPRQTAGATPPSPTAMPDMDLSGRGISDILKKFEERQTKSAAKDIEDKKMAFWSSLAEFGAGAMAGTSPFGATNIGQAAVPAIKSGTAALRDIRAREEKRGIADLQAALEGEKIKADYAKLDIQRPYLSAMADYYRRRPVAGTSTAGLGSVTPAVADKVMTRFQGYEMDPKSAPFFGQLPKDVQTGLTKYKPGTESYRRSMEVFRQYNDQAMQNYLNRLKGLGAKTPVTADES